MINDDRAKRYTETLGVLGQGPNIRAWYRTRTVTKNSVDARWEAYSTMHRMASMMLGARTSDAKSSDVTLVQCLL